MLSGTIVPVPAQTAAERIGIQARIDAAAAEDRARGAEDARHRAVAVARAFLPAETAAA